MNDPMRFRAHLLTIPDVGQRLIVHPANLVEEWDTSTGHGKSYVPRRITEATEHRPGIVRAVKVGRPEVDVILDDVPPLTTGIGSILTVMTHRYLSEPEDLDRLLEHLAGRTLTTTPQRYAVIEASASWLRTKFPDLASLWRWTSPPTYESKAEYVALLDGLGVALGATRSVPAPPFEIRVPPAPDPLRMSGSLPVRGDALRKLGDWRVN